MSVEDFSKQHWISGRQKYAEMKQAEIDQEDPEDLCVLIEAGGFEDIEVSILKSGTAEELEEWLFEVHLPKVEKDHRERGTLYGETLVVEEEFPRQWVIGPEMGWECYVHYIIKKVPDPK